MVTILLDFPSSPQVIVVGGYIVEASEIVCTEEEIAILVEAEFSLTEAAEFLVEAFEVAKENVLEASGSILSASELSAVIGGYIVESAEITEANENIMEATGSTLSASELPEFTEGPEEPTLAARFRMREFRRQLFKH